MSIQNRPSDIEASLTSGGDMSYLYGRDPSILAYGQRPFPSQELKKNLYSLLEEEKEETESIESSDRVTNCSEKTGLQTVKVFLRMKPFPSRITLTKEQAEAYTIIDSTTLLTKMPSLDNNASCLKKMKPNEIVCRNFTFTQTFGPETSQLQLFEEAVKPQMLDFISGQNSAVMSYGTTNSGKTYTLQGNSESPGIIPRGIEFVFSHIEPDSTPHYKPVGHSEVMALHAHERLLEADQKMKLLSFYSLDKNCHINTYRQMQQLLKQEASMSSIIATNARYSVWVSFAEIYNETIYDLLWNGCQKKRPSLKLATDSKGRAYIKGLRSVCVASGSEAYQVLMTGQYNLKVAATALNSKSSRSHCIFTIKLLKYYSQNDPNSVDVSIFSFCDLAGSERLKKTLNVGERLKEAQNINTSLLVLGRCLQTIYTAQSSAKPQKHESIGPFRESKLTRLFQRALSGKEQMSMIVNVNPVPNLYEETQNVLKFSAIAKKIVIERVPISKRRQSLSRFSRIVTQSKKNHMDWENTELSDAADTLDEEDDEEDENSEDEENDEMYTNLLIENKKLKTEIEELKATSLQRDLQTRQEMTDMYTEMIKQIENDWKSRLNDMEEQQEDLRELAVERIEGFYQAKLKKAGSNRSKRALSTSFNEKDDEANEKKDTSDGRLESLMKSMMDASLLDDSYNGNDKSSDDQIKELQEVIRKKNDRIQTMKTFLNEAKEEYITITGEAEKLEEKVKKQEELLIENEEHINDLEEQLNQANAYSAEQSKTIETLEEDLENQTKRLHEMYELVIQLAIDVKLDKDHVPEKINTSNGNESELRDLEKSKHYLKEARLQFESLMKENTELNEKLACVKNTVIMSTQTSDSLLCDSVRLSSDNSPKVHDTNMKETQGDNEKQHVIEEVDKIELEIKNEKAKLEELNRSNLEKELKASLLKLENEAYDLKQLIEKKNEQNKKLMDRLDEAINREREKDDEIQSLNIALKKMLKETEETTTKMELELKKVLQDIVAANLEIQNYKDKCEKMDVEYRQVIHILEMRIGSLERTIVGKHEMIEKLQSKNSELENAIQNQEEEFQKFSANRNETVTKYENLVQVQSQELDKLKKEVERLGEYLIRYNQISTEENNYNTKRRKDTKENTTKQKANKTQIKKEPDMTLHDPNSSDSDHILSPKTVKTASKETVSTKKTRRKKLFNGVDESFVDVDQSGPSPKPTPSISARSLRNRRK
ncbi:hypothetical protein TKK_0002705 [Trichogramma kaykai]|uniref:Kinesin motor domain-containing protein n=1 Tax=Trichogramma kaykai TaxID=54128 RepID=A0ABD2XSR3_9HYME